VLKYSHVSKKGGVTVPTYVRFVELPALDQRRAISFYTEKLGLRVARDQEYREGWNWVLLEIPGAQTKILLTQSSGETRDTPSLVLTVEDVHARHRELAAKGVEFTTEPAVAPWNPNEVYAVFRDSEGNLVMLGSEVDAA